MTNHDEFTTAVSKDPAATLDNGAADAGLRTALTKLAEDWPGGFGEAIRALLAAHPAPETDEVLCICNPTHRDNDPICQWRPGPEADTRREDVARALRMTQATHPDDQARLARWWDEGLTSPEDRAVVLRQADAVLAVLPAPPVVDEAEVREVVAEVLHGEYFRSADIARDVAASRIAAAVAARLRGATR